MITKSSMNLESTRNHEAFEKSKPQDFQTFDHILVLNKNEKGCKTERSAASRSIDEGMGEEDVVNQDEKDEDPDIQAMERLEELKQRDETDAILSQEEDEFLKYDALYGLRVIKAQKRYLNMQNQREKQKELEAKKKFEQNQLWTNYFTNRDHPIKAKERGAPQPRKFKYERQVKIFQNKFIMDL